MKRFLIIGTLLVLGPFALYLKSIPGKENPITFPGHPAALNLPEIREIAGTIRKGETLFDIFRRHKLDTQAVYDLTSASDKVYNLFRLMPNHSYIITTVKTGASGREEVKGFKYSVDDSQYLKISSRASGFKAERIPIIYDRRLSFIEGRISENLIRSLGSDREHTRIAYSLAEIFESDIDFVTELREGDSFRVLLEELWLGGVFKGYGSILAAEFTNNGNTFDAYRFKVNGRRDYYNSKGSSLKKALLRAPLRFKHISSGFSYRRKHPILKIYRPHMGVDYAAPTGTPVSAAGSGTVVHAGWRGGYGKAVIVKHPNGYKTYYGHLSKIKRGLRKWKRVKQGEIIGYVGSTGLSTGPHLDYRVKRYGRYINPLKMKLPRTSSIPSKFLPAFKRQVKILKDELIARSGDFIKVARN